MPSKSKSHPSWPFTVYGWKLKMLLEVHMHIGRQVKIIDREHASLITLCLILFWCKIFLKLYGHIFLLFLFYLQFFPCILLDICKIQYLLLIVENIYVSIYVYFVISAYLYLYICAYVLISIQWFIYTYILTVYLIIWDSVSYWTESFSTGLPIYPVTSKNPPVFTSHFQWSVDWFSTFSWLV